MSVITDNTIDAASAWDRRDGPVESPSNLAPNVMPSRSEQRHGTERRF